MRKSRRIDGGFVAIPYQVIDSPGYQHCKPIARALLIDIARQYNGVNNGQLVIARPALPNWNSREMVYRACNQLIQFGLITKTRRGGKNRTNLYALNWQPLDKHPAIEITLSVFNADHKDAFLRAEKQNPWTVSRTNSNSDWTVSRTNDGSLDRIPDQSLDRIPDAYKNIYQIEEDEEVGPPPQHLRPQLNRIFAAGVAAENCGCERQHHQAGWLTEVAHG